MIAELNRKAGAAQKRRLIAAAPKLLAALKALLDVAPFGATNADREIHQQAEAAIAEAEGK